MFSFTDEHDSAVGLERDVCYAVGEAPADVEGALAVLLAKGLPKAAAPAKVEKPKAKKAATKKKKKPPKKKSVPKVSDE